MKIVEAPPIPVAAVAHVSRRRLGTPDAVMAARLKAHAILARGASLEIGTRQTRSPAVMPGFLLCVMLVERSELIIKQITTSDTLDLFLQLFSDRDRIVRDVLAEINHYVLTQPQGLL
jgi:hypothetical protein